MRVYFCPALHVRHYFIQGSRCVARNTWMELEAYIQSFSLLDKKSRVICWTLETMAMKKKNLKIQNKNAYS
jgi:hypothetical protein